MDNPFLSNTFCSTWAKHFLLDKEAHTFNFAKNLSFYPGRLPGLYINTGRNLTKGINYEFNPKLEKAEKGKTFLIYDTIDFLTDNVELDKSPMGLYAVKQYPGFAINLDSYTSLDDYMAKTFKKSSRYKLRKYKKRLEESFNISFKAFNGEISKEEYDTVFSSFRKLLEKRFEEKQIYNNNLDKKEWDFYKEVAYPMILEKRATLFVLYNNNEPISVTLAYLSNDRIFDAITVFDIDYSKFHLGSIKIMYLVDWCIKNKWKVLDFSKGYFDYKIRWANKQFDFHYHIWFDKKSIKSRAVALYLKLFFSFKQYLRDKNVNEMLHKVTYRLKNKEAQTTEYQFEENGPELTSEQIEELNIHSSDNNLLKRICYDFLYLFPEKESNIKIFRCRDNDDFYLIKGKENQSFVRVNF